MEKLDNNKIYMNESVFVGCEQHVQSCETCQNIQNSQKSNLTCQLCSQATFFCRSKPCQYKFHCLNTECVKSRHNYVFKSKKHDQNNHTRHYNNDNDQNR